MPTISQFFGRIIHMYLRGEHKPPHFHALYAAYEAQINIQTLEVIEGEPAAPRTGTGMGQRAP